MNGREVNGRRYGVTTEGGRRVNGSECNMKRKGMKSKMRERRENEV